MKITLLGVAGAVGIAVGGAVERAAAQTLLYSFETLYNVDGMPDPLGTRPDGFHFNGAGAMVTQDTFGATEQSNSMKFALVTGATFNGAITELGAPFPVINAATTTAISLDYTVRPGEEFIGGFTNLGITEFGDNKVLGEGSAQTVPAAEQPVKLPAGTYRLVIPLIARNNPYTFELDVPFSSIVGPDPNTQMTATSFQFYINKGGTTGPVPVPNAPLTAYIDNVRAVSAQTSAWNVDADGNWSDAGNWLGLPMDVPDGVDANAIFGLGPPVNAARTVTLDAPRTAGALFFNNGAGYTLAGPGTLTVDVSSGPGAINSYTGSHTISAPLVFNDDTTVTVAPAASIFTISGPITASGRTITKAGLGRLDLSPLNAAGLTINGGTAMLLSGGGTSRVQNVTIAGGSAPSAKLDITNNAVVVDYASAGPSPLGTIRAQVAAAFNNGSWDGNGIGSSSADAGALGVGYGEASALASVPAVFGTVDSTAVLLRLTRYGDADLNGTVNLADFNRLAINFGLASGAVWTQGDFNYDGVINLADFNRLAINFGQSAAGPEVTPQDWANLAAAVPEPGAASVATLLATGLLRARRRSRSRDGRTRTTR